MDFQSYVYSLHVPLEVSPYARVSAPLPFRVTPNSSHPGPYVTLATRNPYRNTRTYPRPEDSDPGGEAQEQNKVFESRPDLPVQSGKREG